MTNKTFLDTLVEAGLSQDYAASAKERGIPSILAMAKEKRKNLAKQKPNIDNYNDQDASTVRIVNELMCKVSALNIKFNATKDSHMYTPDYVDDLIRDLITAELSLDRRLIDYYLLFPDQLELALKELYKNEGLTNSPRLSKIQSLNAFIDDHYTYHGLEIQHAGYSDYLRYIFDILKE
jgi:hypothetical protein